MLIEWMVLSLCNGLSCDELVVIDIEVVVVIMIIAEVVEVKVEVE